MTMVTALYCPLCQEALDPKRRCSRCRAAFRIQIEFDGVQGPAGDA